MAHLQLPHKYERVYIHEMNNCILAEMAACMNACMCVAFHCLCTCSLYSVYMCIQLYSAESINDVANKK